SSRNEAFVGAATGDRSRFDRKAAFSKHVLRPVVVLARRSGRAHLVRRVSRVGVWWRFKFRPCGLKPLLEITSGSKRRGQSGMALRTKINPPALPDDSRSLTVHGVF